jgi:hypothetical protein
MMKHIIEINNQKITLSTEELKELWTELNEFFGKKVEFPYTGIREFQPNPWDGNPIWYTNTGDYNIPEGVTTCDSTMKGVTEVDEAFKNVDNSQEGFTFSKE